MKIGLIGGGNMASSLVGGLLASGLSRGDLALSDTSATARARAETHFGITAYADNTALVRGSDVIVLAVKPQALAGLGPEIQGPIAAHCPLVMSIAAGVAIDALQHWFGPASIVRAMPNMPALVRAGMTVLFAGEGVTTGQREQAEAIMKSVGEVAWIDSERLMDPVTALSGSGPAYFFLVMEALEQAAAATGLDAATARRLIRQTALGSALMAAQDDPAALRAKVTSPGGTTEQALAVLEQRGLRAAFADAVAAAQQRSRELSDQYR